MINKKSIWFLTLFSLILVLSVYYITMPSELLLNTNANYNKDKEKEPTVEISESTALVALRVQKEEEILKQIDELKLILTNNDSTIALAITLVINFTALIASSFAGIT